MTGAPKRVNFSHHIGARLVTALAGAEIHSILGVKKNTKFWSDPIFVFREFHVHIFI